MPSSVDGGDGATTLREQMAASAVCVQATIMQVHAMGVFAYSEKARSDA